MPVAILQLARGAEVSRECLCALPYAIYPRYLIQRDEKLSIYFDADTCWLVFDVVCKKPKRERGQGTEQESN